MGKLLSKNEGPEAFLGLIFLVSEDPETKLKVFLGLIGPSPESINMVGWPGDHLNPYSTLGICFGDNSLKQWSNTSTKK